MELCPMAKKFQSGGRHSSFVCFFRFRQFMLLYLPLCCEKMRINKNEAGFRPYCKNKQCFLRTYCISKDWNKDKNEREYTDLKPIFSGDGVTSTYLEPGAPLDKVDYVLWNKIIKLLIWLLKLDDTRRTLHLGGRHTQSRDELLFLLFNFFDWKMFKKFLKRIFCFLKSSSRARHRTDVTVKHFPKMLCVRPCLRLPMKLLAEVTRCCPGWFKCNCIKII